MPPDGPGDRPFLLFAAVLLPGALVFLALARGGGLDPLPAVVGAVLFAAGSGLAIRQLRRAALVRDAGASRSVEAAGEALRLRIATLEAILEGLPLPVLEIDRERRLLLANRASKQLFGTVALGRDLVASVRDPALNEAVDRVLAGGEGCEVEVTLALPAERVLAARIEPAALPDAAGRGALVALYDMTQVKQADRLRADFVANASHELRTPLASLIGFIETLQGPAHDDLDARERFLAIMAEQAQRMARLIADLLSLSRIELNEHQPPTGRVDLGAVLVGIAAALAFRAAERRMTIELGVPPPAAAVQGYADVGALPAVQGDRDELTQLFQNLIDNAIKYGRSGTPVAVACWRDPAGLGGRPALAVAVIDQGEGIPREHLPRLTERFYRVDKARSRDLGGTGLGLAIVKHILNRHRGRLAIDSTPGQGSRFTVFLPLVDET
jgi:two-component system phosphate regulon sensor histidine kinase PhoR